MPPSSLPPEHSQWFLQEVQPFEQPLRSYLRQALPRLEDVDDLVQDIYMRLLRAKANGAIRSPKPFLFAVARNVVRDFMLRKSKAPWVASTEETTAAVSDGNIDVVELVCRRQELALLREAIQSLPERCREVLILRKVKGLSQRQIAELLGISENTVESLAVRGTQRCAEFLKARGVDRSASHHVS